MKDTLKKLCLFLCAALLAFLPAMAEESGAETPPAEAEKEAYYTLLEHYDPYPNVGSESLYFLYSRDADAAQLSVDMLLNGDILLNLLLQADEDMLSFFADGMSAPYGLRRMNLSADAQILLDALPHLKDEDAFSLDWISERTGILFDIGEEESAVCDFGNGEESARHTPFSVDLSPYLKRSLPASGLFQKCICKLEMDLYRGSGDDLHAVGVLTLKCMDISEVVDITFTRHNGLFHLENVPRPKEDEPDTFLGFLSRGGEADASANADEDAAPLFSPDICDGTWKDGVCEGTMTDGSGTLEFSFSRQDNIRTFYMELIEAPYQTEGIGQKALWNSHTLSVSWPRPGTDGDLTLDISQTCHEGDAPAAADLTLHFFLSAPKDGDDGPYRDMEFATSVTDPLLFRVTAGEADFPDDRPFLSDEQVHRLDRLSDTDNIFELIEELDSVNKYIETRQAEILANDGL